MTVTISPTGTIELTGNCPVDEAETLLQYLLSAPQSPVDWAGCDWVHTAVIQVLLVAKACPSGSPGSSFLRDYVGPLLTRRAT